jgi:enamine deaminase RidA (YjgF/YER057c/UK114 family)
MTSDTTPPAHSSLEYLQPAGLGKPEEPYSLAIRSGNQLFLAGMVAFDENNQVVGQGDPGKQAEQCWRNIELAIEAAGGSLANVVKITVYYKDIRYMHDEIAVRGKLFADGRCPVCTIVQVGNLGMPELLMEIDATVILEDR